MLLHSFLLLVDLFHMMSGTIIALQDTDASSLNAGHARGRLHTPKPFPRFVDHIIALVLLHKMLKQRRMWKDRLLSLCHLTTIHIVSQLEPSAQP